MPNETRSLAKPVLLMRDTTQHPGAVEADTVRPVAIDLDRIVEEPSMVLDQSTAYENMARCHALYGNGYRTERIVKTFQSH